MFEQIAQKTASQYKVAGWKTNLLGLAALGYGLSKVSPINQTIQHTWGVAKPYVDKAAPWVKNQVKNFLFSAPKANETPKAPEAPKAEPPKTAGAFVDIVDHLAKEEKKLNGLRKSKDLSSPPEIIDHLSKQVIPKIKVSQPLKDIPIHDHLSKQVIPKIKVSQPLKDIPIHDHLS